MGAAVRHARGCAQGSDPGRGRGYLYRGHAGGAGRHDSE
jgi:hypothetical protein